MKYLIIAFALLAHCAYAEERQSFDEWLSGIREDALARGISEETVALLDGIERDERVIGFDRRQPEFVQTFDEYLDARVTQYRIDKARELFREHREVLEAIGARYGVEPQYLVAFWGLESSFGRYQGKYSILRSLATLAYDPRRSAFFTSELFAALQILDEGHVPPDEFVGGWAGAMGQNQFLPSSFLKYAQDFDGDGKKNIWTNQVDVWASIANYLDTEGWQHGAGWGSEAKLAGPVNFEMLRPETVPPGCRALRHHTRKMAVSEWDELGVEPVKELPSGTWALVIPGDGDESNWLVGGNFRTILHYNCANKYAVSVGLLADHIAAANQRAAAIYPGRVLSRSQ